MDAQEVDRLLGAAYPKLVRDKKKRTLLYLASNVILLLPPTHSPLAIAWFKNRLTPEQREAYAIAHFRELKNPTSTDLTSLITELTCPP